jgi:hypothetical protein
VAGIALERLGQWGIGIHSLHKTAINNATRIGQGANLDDHDRRAILVEQPKQLGTTGRENLEARLATGGAIGSGELLSRVLS